jgi:ferrous iron transport protein A
VNLLDLNIGEEAIIRELKIDNSLKFRLQDIGFLKNTKIKVLHSSPSGDPRAYFIKNTTIALRNKDAKNIIVQKEGEESGRYI